MDGDAAWPGLDVVEGPHKPFGPPCAEHQKHLRVSRHMENDIPAMYNSLDNSQVCHLRLSWTVAVDPSQLPPAVGIHIILALGTVGDVV
jgi:hypothetical protein